MISRCYQCGYTDELYDGYCSSCLCSDCDAVIPHGKGICERCHLKEMEERGIVEERDFFEDDF